MTDTLYTSTIYSNFSRLAYFMNNNNNSIVRDIFDAKLARKEKGVIISDRWRKVAIIAKIALIES